MKRRTRVWRGFLLGVVLVPLNALWVLQMERIGGRGPWLSTISLFFNVVFIMTFLALANGALQRLLPRLALNRSEMVIVYVMLCIGTSLAGLDMMQVLPQVMTHGFWFATPENRWEQMLADVPRWLVVSDKKILYGYYSGSSTVYQWPVIRAWLAPALFWAGFILVLVFVMVCLSVIVRAQWADRERLTFPIIELPLELTNPRTRLFSSPLLWVGLGAAGLVDLINGLNFIFPSVPYLSVAPTATNWTANDLMKYIAGMPWRGIGWLPVTFYPAVIGLCFLLPTDLLFSCWFLFFWWKALFVIAAATGLSDGYSGGMSKCVFPYANEQMFGGYLGIALGPMLVGRRHLRNVWVRILGKPSEANDAAEGLSYRTAGIGAVVGTGLLVAFSVAAGMSLGLAIAFFIIYYLLALAVARVRAEFGSPVHDFHFTGPDYTISYVLGTANIGERDLAMFTEFWWFNRAYRCHPIASTIEGLQMAARTRTPGRAVTGAVMLATLVGAVSVFWIWLHYAYGLGVASKWGQEEGFGDQVFARLQSWTENPTQPNLTALGAMGAGFVITMLLAGARSAFVGWPFHPVAYALSASWSIHLVWMPMLIAWAAKMIVLRYGGLRAYRRALPIFLGLILGETLVGCGWTLVGLIFRIPTYSFWGL